MSKPSRCEWHLPHDLENYVLPHRPEIVYHRTVDVPEYRDAAKRLELTRKGRLRELSWQFVVMGALYHVAGMTPNEAAKYVPGFTRHQVDTESHSLQHRRGATDDDPSENAPQQNIFCLTCTSKNDGRDQYHAWEHECDEL